jgi:hypothetical protein
MTSSATAASSVDSEDSIPFATPEEMFLIKICARRPGSSWSKSLQDVADAEFIAENTPTLNLIGTHKGKAYKCLTEFMPRSQYSNEWWHRKLGLLLPGTCTFADWFFLLAHSQGICPSEVRT